MKLWEFNRTNVIITLKNGVVVRGFVEDYCDAFDNAEEMDSLLVDVDGTPREYFEMKSLVFQQYSASLNLGIFVILFRRKSKIKSTFDRASFLPAKLVK